MKTRFFIGLCIIFMISCSSKQENRNDNGIPVVECRIVRVSDNYFEDTIKYDKYMGYPRRVYILAYAKNKGMDTAYIPLKLLFKSESPKKSRISTYWGNKKIHSYTRVIYTNDLIDEFKIAPQDSAVIKIVLESRSLYDAGISRYYSPKDLLHRVKFVYEKNTVDTTGVGLPISDITFKIDKNIIYEFRDTIHPEADMEWVL